MAGSVAPAPTLPWWAMAPGALGFADADADADVLHR
jgi:hypothetical protein